MTLRLNGSTSGYTEIDAPAVAGSNTITLPTGAGSANQFLKNGSTAGSLGWSSLAEDSSGLVGIGTTSPGAALHVVNATSKDQLRLGTANTEQYQIGRDASSGLLFFYGTQTGYTGYVFDGVNGERARIDSSGRLLVGTTSGSGKLTVSGNAIGTTVALTDAATIATDLSLANYYTLTLGGNRTLGAPTNQTAGQSGVIVITQDGTGSRTLAYNSVWKFPSGTVPTLTTTANAVDVLAYYVESGTRITARLLSDVK